jgi:hypothetical protein
MNTAKNLLETHPSEWRRWLLDPVVPEGEGDAKPLSIAYPEKMLERIDKVAHETHNSRSETIRHLLRWALNAYDKGRAAESGLEQKKSKKAS